MSASTAAARIKVKVKDVGKINFFIYYEVDGDTSKHSLQSTAPVRPGPSVGAPRTRSTQVYVGSLGSRGGHAVVSYFFGAKPTAAFLNGTVS